MRSLACLVAICLTTSAFGQPAPNRQPAHDLFAKEAGTWDCDVKMYLKGPTAAPSEFKGVEVNTLVSGGLYVQTSFKFKMGAREFEGHSLVGYDPRSKTYVGTWVDNFTSIPRQIKSEYNEAAKTLTTRSTVVDGAGKEIQNKEVVTWLDNGKKKLEIFMIIDSAGKQTEVILMESTATKRAKANEQSANPPAPANRPDIDALKVRILAVERTTAADVRFLSLTCEASNVGKAPLMFLGYRADAFDPPIAEPNISPIHVIEFLRDGQWQTHPQGWCGTGMGGISLPAGGAKKFAFAVPEGLAGQIVRVGIRWSKPQDFDTAKPESFETAWSPRFEIGTINDAKEKGAKGEAKPK
jgi:hypothetical protein